MPSGSGSLSIPVFCVETEGYNGNPIGDYFYNGVYAYNPTLLRGGSANDGSVDVTFYGNWNLSEPPCLKNP